MVRRAEKTPRHAGVPTWRRFSLAACPAERSGQLLCQHEARPLGVLHAPLRLPFCVGAGSQAARHIGIDPIFTQADQPTDEVILPAMPPLRLLAVNGQSVDLLLLEALLSEVLPTIEFTSCLSAAQALDHLSRVDPLPHLVLVNLHLVGLSGLDLIRQLALDPRLRVLPVIVLTGSVNPEDRTHALEAGAADYLVRPVNIAEQERQLLHLVQTWQPLYDAP